jgi:hypothetical protein
MCWAIQRKYCVLLKIKQCTFILPSKDNGYDRNCTSKFGRHVPTCCFQLQDRRFSQTTWVPWQIILSQCYCRKSKFSMVWCWVTGWAVSNVSRDESPAVPDALLDPQDETLHSSKFQALFNKWDSIAEEKDIMNDYIGATTQSREDQNEWLISGPTHRSAAWGGGGFTGTSMVPCTGFPTSYHTST